MRLCGQFNRVLAGAVARYLNISIRTGVGARRQEIFVGFRRMCAARMYSSNRPPSPNDHLMELLVMVDAFAALPARRITAVHYFGYARRTAHRAARFQPSWSPT
jgi:ribose-phosphate pyrophosphokinase